MKKVLVLLAMVLGATNMYAQDYDLQGLAKICEKAQVVGSFENGYLIVILDTIYMNTITIDKKGNIITPDNISYKKKDIRYKSDDYRVVVKNGKYGYQDKDGKLVIPYMFSYAERFKEGCAAVKNGKLYGYINEDGKLITSFIFEQAEYFSEGLACVSILSNNRKFGFIDHHGNSTFNFSINPNANEIVDMASNYLSYGQSMVSDGQDGTTFFKLADELFNSPTLTSNELSNSLLVLVRSLETKWYLKDNENDKPIVLKLYETLKTFSAEQEDDLTTALYCYMQLLGYYDAIGENEKCKNCKDKTVEIAIQLLKLNPENSSAKYALDYVKMK